MIPTTEFSTFKKQRERQSLSLLLWIRSAIVAEITIYLHSLLFAHKCREYIFANFCFFAGITHFLKLRSTVYGKQPSFYRLIRLFGIPVFSVILQKSSEGIVWGVRHSLLDFLAIRKQRESQLRNSG
jgi:hypothetical protein